MINNKFSMKVSKEVFAVVFKKIEQYIERAGFEKMDYAEKLNVVLFIGLHKKLLPLYHYPSSKNVLKMNAAEALAFYLSFCNSSDGDIFETVVMKSVTDAIHKQYC